MKNTVYTVLLTLLVCMPTVSRAQVDPVLAGMIVEFTQKAKSQYDSQLKTMAIETEGHVWLKQEVESTKNYQKQFDDYLNSFRNVISYAAQTYGFYCEVSHLCENMGKLSSQIGDTPVNAIAVALHNKRNDIYVSIINKSCQHHSAGLHRQEDDRETTHRTGVFRPSSTKGYELSVGHAHQTCAVYQYGTCMV